MIIDPESERVLGVGICGAGAGELIAEAVLAIEMGATAEDIALTVHPHPTLSETLMECAEAFYGHATHTMCEEAGVKAPTSKRQAPENFQASPSKQGNGELVGGIGD